MQYNIYGNILTDGCVVVDPYGHIWFIAEIEEGEALCKNGLTSCKWSLEALTRVRKIAS